MVLNVGIISACILYKNRPGAQTRLQKLQRKLKQKPISQKVLYSYPIKKIFSILMIICFMIGLLLFLNEYKLDLDLMHGGLMNDKVLEIKEETHFLFPYRPIMFLGNQQTKNHKNSSQIFNSIKDHKQYKRVSKTVFWMLVFFTIPLVVLAFSLDFQKIIIKARQIGDSVEISGHIQKQTLSLPFIWMTTQNYACKESDRFCIEQCGESRFSNTTFYYAIKKISRDQSKQNVMNPESSPETVPKVIEEVIIKKGSVYEARQAIIYMCHIFKKEVNLSIKNGPVKEKKTKNLTKKMKQTKTE